MNLNFRVRRRVGISPETMPMADPPDSPDLWDLFRHWQAACARLRTAEHANADPDAVLGLAVEVIRARNSAARAQIAAGWEPPISVVWELERDELLVQEADDRHLFHQPGLHQTGSGVL